MKIRWPWVREDRPARERIDGLALDLSDIGFELKRIKERISTTENTSQRALSVAQTAERHWQGLSRAPWAMLPHVQSIEHRVTAIEESLKSEGEGLADGVSPTEPSPADR